MIAATRTGSDDVVVGAEEQPLRSGRRPSSSSPLVAVKPVGAQQRALDEPGDDRRRRRGAGPPSTACRCRARRARSWATPGGDPGPLGVELGAVAEADQDVAAPVGVGDRQPLELALGLAAVEQRLERAAGQIVGYALVLEHADDDRVGAGFGGTLGRVARPSPGEDLPSASLGFTQRPAASAPPTTRRPAPMPKTVILVSRPHADRQARRRAGEPRRHRARRHGDQGRARARRGGARPGAARRDGPGAPGRAGSDPLAPGSDQGRDPEGDPLGDDQQGLRLGHPRRRAARRRDPRRRSRGRRRRRDGVDVERPVPAQGGPLRLPDGRRQGDRRDDQRRPDQPVLGQAHGPGGQRGRRPSSS